FLIAIIGYAVGGLIDLELSKYQTYPTTFFIYRLVYPIGYFPWDLIILGIQTGSIGFKIVYLGIFISLVVASIIAGLFGGDALRALGGWALTMITSVLLLIIISSIENYYIGFYCFGCDLGQAVITALVIFLVNLLIFGALAALIAYLRGRS
ncbi:MAG: hypothetical protein ACFFB6_12565, partial [Promethearchaeota archaeon]